MTPWIRFLLFAAWLGAAAWAWHAGLLGAAAACVLSAASSSLCLWPASGRRRGSRVLRYIEMAKQPVSLQ